MSKRAKKRKQDEPEADGPAAAAKTDDKKDGAKMREDAMKKWPEGSICHFEFPMRNLERAKKFYGDIFHFTFKPAMGTAYLPFTDPAGNGGGFYEKKDGEFARNFFYMPHMHTPDINAVLTKLVAAGGAVTRPRYLIGPGIGSNAFALDTEGNHIGLYAVNGDNVVPVKDIEQQVVLRGTPHDVYETLLDSERHSKMNPELKTAKIDRAELGAFTVGDYISGRNIQCVQDVKLVQSWRGADWPTAHWSHLTYEFSRHAPSGHTLVKMTQKYVPAANADDISTGWFKFYWTPMGVVQRISPA